MLWLAWLRATSSRRRDCGWLLHSLIWTPVPGSMRRCPYYCFQDSCKWDPAEFTVGSKEFRAETRKRKFGDCGLFCFPRQPSKPQELSKTRMPKRRHEGVSQVHPWMGIMIATRIYNSPHPIAVEWIGLLGGLNQFSHTHFCRVLVALHACEVLFWLYCVLFCFVSQC